MPPMARAPRCDQAYVPPREDTAIQGLKSERFLSADIAYVWNYNRFRGSVGGFITEMWNGIKRTGFYDYQLNTFMNYSMSGMHTQYRGIELGMSYKILPSLTASAAATIASYKYKNDPLGVPFVRERLAGRRYPPRLPQELPYRWHAAAGLQRLAQLCRTEKLVLRAFCQLDGRRIRRPRSVAA